MATKDWLVPVVAIGGLGALALYFFSDTVRSITGGGTGPLPPMITNKKPKVVTDDGIEIDKSPIVSPPDFFKGGGEAPDYVYGDLYKQRFAERPPIKKIPIVDVSDIIDRRGVENDENAYIITDKDFKLFDINREERDLLNRKYRIKQPTLSKVIYGDKGDRPVIVPYYDGYSYATSAASMRRKPEIGRLTNEQQSNSNDRKNTINLY